ncbi:hypothetical protein A4X09_0g7360 [Tilletia walkeri]|uniref:Uncharacterized protein n=1 Tax=Tilletia walkeri TaxID=117179 RepID=A0A8X7T1Q6_9BASI|nr:hypothetical protein A4X09_0g7360 [Tilletia walkeri]
MQPQPISQNLIKPIPSNGVRLSSTSEGFVNQQAYQLLALTCRALHPLIRFRRPEARRRWAISCVLRDYDSEGADNSKVELCIDLPADQ